MATEKIEVPDGYKIKCEDTTDWQWTEFTEEKWEALNK